MHELNFNTNPDSPPAKKHCADESISETSNKVAHNHDGSVRETETQIEEIEEAVKANQLDVLAILLKNLNQSKVNFQRILDRLLIMAAQFATKDIILKLIAMGAELNLKCMCHACYSREGCNCYSCDKTIDNRRQKTNVKVDYEFESPLSIAMKLLNF